MKKLIFISLLLFNELFAYDRITGLPFATRSEVIGQNGMAATSHPLATQTAIDVLKSGGNAIDAAIAANAVLGLVEPTGCGIGGDLFAIVWDEKTNQLYRLNSSGPAPQKMSIDYVKQQGFEKNIVVLRKSNTFEHVLKFKFDMKILSKILKNFGRKLQKISFGLKNQKKF